MTKMPGDPYVQDVRVSGINSQFKLSLRTEFQAALESVAAQSLARTCVLSKNLLTMEFSNYNGRCDIKRNGFVRLFTQLNFEEAIKVAQKVVYDFHTFGRQEVGLFEHHFIVVSVAAELPFRVSLNRMKSAYPEIEFAPEIEPPARIVYEDLGASITLQVSGKLTMMCSGDCTPPDFDMKNTLKAVERVAAFAHDFMIPNTWKSDTTNIVKSKKSLIKGISSANPRRSDRLLYSTLPEGPESQPIPMEEIIQHPANLTTEEYRIFQFCSMFALKHGRKELTHDLSSVVRHQLSAPRHNEPVATLKKVYQLVEGKEIEPIVQEFEEIEVPPETSSSEEGEEEAQVAPGPAVKQVRAVKKLGRPKLESLLESGKRRKATQKTPAMWDVDAMTVDGALAVFNLCMDGS